MSVKIETEQVELLEKLLDDAHSEAEEIRKELARCKQIIASTRMIMGHELKKPTTALSGYLELVCEDLESSNELSTLALAEKARDECRLLDELNAFYLDLLRSDADDDVVGKPLTDVAKTVRNIVDGFPGKYDAINRVEVNVHSSVPLVAIDGSALKLIVMNLIENALLYSQVSSLIQVDVNCEPDRRGMTRRKLLKIVVSDKGIGIPEDFLKRVFSPFVRLRDDIAEGSGLGLTLVKSLVELNQGDVFVESERGQGTAVHVTIPTPEGQDEETIIIL